MDVNSAIYHAKKSSSQLGVGMYVKKHFLKDDYSVVGSWNVTIFLDGRLEADITHYSICGNVFKVIDGRISKEKMPE